MGASQQALLAAGGSSDSSFSSVVMLIPMSTDFTDVKGKTVTVVGNSAVNGTDPIFTPSVSTGVFDGTGDYLTLASHTDFDLTADFTIEGFERPSGAKGGPSIVTYRSASTGLQWSILLDDATGVLNAATNNDGSPLAANIASAAGAMANNVWTHWAYTRLGNVYTLWVGGASQGTVTASGAYTAPGNGVVYIGRDPTATTRDYAGRKAQYRITKGLARYTAAFTPPSAPFPTS